jgi:hypothetical protein
MIEYSRELRRGKEMNKEQTSSVALPLKRNTNYYTGA